ncbi:hypothetical protein [Tenacibaculum agarivorans]|uniref:hypothetical protein n=1 Tax=Tenacibaculum agarivorans TaxID=1908389 RepID=UPI00094BC2BD|nr:hypothetical protein [Tenacibaculum agarivorans]
MDTKEDNYSFYAISLIKGIQKMFLSAFILMLTSVFIIYAALTPTVIAAIVLVIVALLATGGCIAVRNFTAGIKNLYATNPAAAFARYGFTSYAALRASIPAPARWCAS